MSLCAKFHTFVPICAIVKLTALTIGTMSAFNSLCLGHYFQIELKLVITSYFNEHFPNLRPKLKFSKIITFLTSHFGTLLELWSWL